MGYFHCRCPSRMYHMSPVLICIVEENSRFSQKYTFCNLATRSYRKEGCKQKYRSQLNFPSQSIIYPITTMTISFSWVTFFFTSKNKIYEMYKNMKQVTVEWECFIFFSSFFLRILFQLNCKQFHAMKNNFISNMHWFMYQKGGQINGSNITVNEAKRIGKWMGLKDLESLPWA